MKPKIPSHIHLTALLLLLLFTASCRPSSAAIIFPTPADPSPTRSLLPLPASPTASVDVTVPVPTPTLVIPTGTALPSPTSSPAPTATPARTNLLFTGVIVPARCVQSAIDASGDPDYLYAEVRDLISSADLAVGTLNATISAYPPHTGCKPTYVLVGSPENADAMARAGFDAMSVATNHIKNCGLSNCGDRAFFDTLDNLRRVGILPVGAGKNLAEAMQPLVVTLNGVRFGIVSLGQIEPLAFSTENGPGIAVLTEENLRSAITAARKVSDVVIAMPHWGPENSPNPNALQQQLARVAVEAGADLVVGNHTHVVQAVQEIDGVTVFYGLGNFVFDQNWSLDHQQGVILQVFFEGKQFAGYKLVPTHVDFDGRVHLAGEPEAQQILDRIEAASQKLP